MWVYILSHTYKNVRLEQAWAPGSISPTRLDLGCPDVYPEKPVGGCV